MGNAVFPEFPGLKWGRKKTAVWSTGTQKSASGREFRTAYYTYPQWRFSLSFEVLRTKASVNELEKLAGFFNARKGSFESFLYEDPADNAVTDQPVGNTVQGVARYQLVRSMGGFIEPVSAVKERPAVKVGGTALAYGRDYTVTDKGVLVFNTPQPPGRPITWTGGFYFRVRFTSDTVDFENVLGSLWAAKKIEFTSVKL
ncbi:DUF2460 domain-containing protein [Neisseria gonorrhoeae]|uniref:DUF2460 domain-containing protein n=9 Tax=Neisseria gonorrhoeae TaxID=485 RepID=Q5F993_NEIG1|nr:DUF2460 domain-containing protein [Neisseria gonorrhoeae]AAW89244.1 hypothetical protein NGO_0506 [Neisseria gonorrhoeae FA 1090]ACF30101.1 putative phage associated protein [Neisseria gonorrhoeae NCCP11945]AKP09947.1 hypothetical protein VT05_00247 [Neisseria gonorrhoeae]AKP12550.1 hypothetical protein WX60_00630 [Neisseria gonorrhoeae]ANJ48004.1 hypothetical protein ASO12_06025 [Neisseria gonorrhoeae]